MNGPKTSLTITRSAGPPFGARRFFIRGVSHSFLSHITMVISKYKVQGLRLVQTITQRIATPPLPNFAGSEGGAWSPRYSIEESGVAR